MNSTKLDEVNDMGRDGNMAMNTPYKFFARDAFSFSLSYFDGDYAPIRGPQVGTANCWLSDNAGSFTQANRFDLWNGNIGAMATTLNTGGATPTNLYQNMAYQYDQLNRLISAVGQGNFNDASNNWGALADISNRYRNEFTYDPNGNILTQKRRNQAGTIFDDLIYRYNYNNEGRLSDNRLYHVTDNISSSVNADDIDNQLGVSIFGPRIKETDAANVNYAYDALGQLIQDKQEKIENIVWRVDGKISDIYRVNGTLQKELSFVYDAMGNRVAKNVLSSSGSWIETEFYVRDAQGNVMAIYKKDIRNDQMNFNLTEQHNYGSARLGVDRRNVDMIAASTPIDNVTLAVKRGEKHYELSNHLGNVLATVSDKKIAVMSGANLSYYRADVVSYSDYYPFGAPMTERTAVVTPTDVRYGFQGQEEDDELWSGSVSFKYRVEDARLGRFFSVDPKHKEYPWNSTYAFSENSLIAFVELEGLEKVYFGSRMVDFTNMSDAQIQTAIDANEIAHRGHLTIHNIKYDFPKSSVWSISSYTRDGIPAGTQFTKYESEADRSNGKVSWEYEYRGPLQTFGHVLDQAFGEGSADPGLRGDAMQGEEGLKEYSAGLGYTGVAMEATVYLAPIGALLSFGNFLIDSCLDIKNEDAATAAQNIAIRVAYMGTGQAIKKMIPNNSDSAEEIVGSGSLLLSNKVSEDQAVKENTERDK